MAGDKIRDDEIMSDEKLDNVAGGNWWQTANDIKKAGMLGLVNVNPDDWNSIEKFYFDNRGELTDIFAKFGVQYIQNESMRENNEFVYNGQKISRDEAWKIIEQQLGK